MADRSVHPTTAPRYRVCFTADGRGHDAHVAYLERADAEEYRDILLENPDITGAHVVCPHCEDADDGIDEVSMCDECMSYPLMPPRPWSVDPSYRDLETCEHCEACGDPFALPDEGIHTANDAPLCLPCCRDGVSPRTWARMERMAR